MRKFLIAKEDVLNIAKDGAVNTTIEADKVVFKKTTGTTLFFNKKHETSTIFEICAVVPIGYLITEIKSE